MLARDRDDPVAARGSSTCWPRRKAADVTVLFKEADAAEHARQRPHLATGPTRWRSPRPSGEAATRGRPAARCTRRWPRRSRAGAGRVRARAGPRRCSGVVNLDKPVGPTSHDMVGLLRRLTGSAADRPCRHPRPAGVRRAADPGRGRHPLQRGADRRLASATTRSSAWAPASATDDARGTDRPRCGAASADRRGDRRRPWRRFVGTFDQLPPAFSARKLGGRTAHRAARCGRATGARAAAGHGPLDRPARRHTRDDAVAGRRASTCVADRAPTSARSRATSGAALGCGGYLHALRRTEAAGLRVEDAIDARAARGAAPTTAGLAEAVLPVGRPARRCRACTSPTTMLWRFVHGSRRRWPVRATPAADGRRVVLDSADQLLGVGSLTTGQLQPEKVLADGRGVTASSRAADLEPAGDRAGGAWASSTASIVDIGPLVEARRCGRERAGARSVGARLRSAPRRGDPARAPGCLACCPAEVVVARLRAAGRRSRAARSLRRGAARAHRRGVPG